MDNVDIKHVINLNNLINGAYVYLTNYRRYNSEMTNNLLNIQINNENVVNKINVSFKRKGILYTKDIYIIMTNNMIETISKINNSQYFMDVTY